MPHRPRKARRQGGGDQGLSIIVVFLVFFPLFLGSIVMLIEASHLQSMKGQNDIVSHIAVNAAVRQADYAGLESGSATKIRLLDSGSGSPTEFLDYNSNAALSNLYANSNSLLRDTTAAGLDKVDGISAGSMARLMYHINANLNGLNSATLGAGAGKTASPDAGIQVVVHNLDYSAFWNYNNQTLGRSGTSSFPGVEMNTGVEYTVTPLLSYLTAGRLATMNVRSQTIAQVVPSRSGGR